MQEQMNERELTDRLSLIEAMIAEGRRSTERWGWTFVLWGVAYLVALAWSMWGRSNVAAWPVTMAAAMLLMWVRIKWGGRRDGTENQPETAAGRAVFSVWIAMAVSMVLLLLSLGFSGRVEWHLFVAIVSAMLGTANAASSMILRWKLQFGCAVVWWAAAVVACFGSDAQSMAGFLIAIFLCQIVFGIYCMVGERGRRRQQHGAVHA
jgi:hypothetical protein